jgi:hypothetical protein
LEAKTLKTREQIYGNEASDLLRNISMYKTLTEEQIRRLYPGKETVMINLLEHLIRQRRVYRNPENNRISANTDCDSQADSGMIAAVWVLIDFIDKAEYHSAGDFPVKISFFADGELYEIIYVPYEQEILMNHALSEKNEIESRRIVLIDVPEQIKTIDIPNTTGFCSVSPDGAVQYYKLK